MYFEEPPAFAGGFFYWRYLLNPQLLYSPAHDRGRAELLLGSKQILGSIDV